MTDGLPLLHSKDIEGELSELLSSSREHYLFAFFGTSDVTNIQVSGSGMFPVYSVRGLLELRQRLLELEGNDARAVFLVPWREGLPFDVAGRFARQSVHVVGKEARLKRLLGGVRQVDTKLLRGHPLVDHLLGHAQPASLQLGELEVSERKLWEVWLARAWGLDTEGGLAADVLLASAAENGRGAEFAEVVRQAPKLGTALLQLLEDTLGPVGPVLLRAWMAGKGEAALEVALVCEAAVRNGTMSAPSPLKRREVVDALRIGSVPQRGLELFAVGMDRFEPVLTEELDTVAAGKGKFKAVRGEYGTGKTFFSHWLCHLARRKGFATAIVQISETDTPLYRMETVYRRALESLQTEQWADGAFRSLIDSWFFGLEEVVLESGRLDPNDTAGAAQAVGELLETRLASVSATQPQFAAALRACHVARVRGDHATAEGLIAWLMGQPNVGAGIKRAANLKGEIDHTLAGGFLRGILEVLRQIGQKGRCWCSTR